MAYKRGYASLLLTYALVGYSMLICSANKNYKAFQLIIVGPPTDLDRKL